jgi:linoleoyl-CoA desaturase
MKQRFWYIDRRAYDLTSWIAKHPGGGDPLLQAEGTDCTELFRSYHLMREPAAKALARYEVPIDGADPRHVEGMGGSHFTFAPGDFYREVQARARAYFERTGLSTNASPLGQAISVALVLAAIGLLVPAFVYGSVTCALALALLKTVASVGPGHSMSHFSLFPRGRWNVLLFRLASPFLVSNPAIWSASHVQSHHVRTLTEHDLQDHYPLKRVQPALAHRGWHRAQHVYVWLVYLLGLPLWALQDFARSVVSLFTGKHAGVGFSLAQRIENTLVIGANLLLTVALPFFFLPFRQALLVCALVNVPSSFLLVVQIAVNHEVPDTMGKVVPGAPIDWGAHQVLTSHNFAVGSTIALHLSGGLNLQIEHHLFPGVHYRHYGALSRIVREACAEFGLPYNTSRSLWEAMGKHYRVLERNSTP